MVSGTVYIKGCAGIQLKFQPWLFNLDQRKYKRIFLWGRITHNDDPYLLCHQCYEPMEDSCEKYRQLVYDTYLCCQPDINILYRSISRC